MDTLTIVLLSMAAFGILLIIAIYILDEYKELQKANAMTEEQLRENIHMDELSLNMGKLLKIRLFSTVISKKRIIKRKKALLKSKFS